MLRTSRNARSKRSGRLLPLRGRSLYICNARKWARWPVLHIRSCQRYAALRQLSIRMTCHIHFRKLRISPFGTSRIERIESGPELLVFAKIMGYFHAALRDRLPFGLACARACFKSDARSSFALTMWAGKRERESRFSQRLSSSGFA